MGTTRLTTPTACKMEAAGFKEQTPRFDGQRTEFVRSGIEAYGQKFDNAHQLELHYNFNGSGPKAFGGAKEWPVVTAKVVFQTGEEDMRDEFAEKLASFINSFMVERGR